MFQKKQIGFSDFEQNMRTFKRFSVSAIVFYPFCGRIFLSLNKNGISFIIDSIAGMVEW